MGAIFVVICIRLGMLRFVVFEEIFLIQSKANKFDWYDLLDRKYETVFINIIFMFFIGLKMVPI